jgi:hypothetical protein
MSLPASSSPFGDIARASFAGFDGMLLSPKSDANHVPSQQTMIRLLGAISRVDAMTNAKKGDAVTL